VNSIAQSQETFAQHIAKNEDFAQLGTILDKIETEPESL
jgi:hypothetical protein